MGSPTLNKNIPANLDLAQSLQTFEQTIAVLKRLGEVFLDLLSKWDCKLVEFNGEEDHIHLLFQYHPDVALSNLVNNVKSVSSRRLRQEFEERVNQFYRKDVLWNSSYFVASCGGVTISTLRKYIENQDTPD
jgi:putative transposase